MGDGRIEEIGTHEELLRKGGAYTALLRGQLT
jgi:ATP-binding cassette subfamily B protein